jgi:Phosphoenolpyruvate carboxykinase C-terminal P-loop domain
MPASIGVTTRSGTKTQITRRFPPGWKKAQSSANRPRHFGVVPGTNYKSNPNAMQSMRKDTIFTNVAITAGGPFDRNKRHVLSATGHWCPVPDAMSRLPSPPKCRYGETLCRQRMALEKV